MTLATQTPIDEEIRLEPVAAAAQLECNCPDDCERDHEND
jgi:hypothetical protein